MNTNTEVVDDDMGIHTFCLQCSW